MFFGNSRIRFSKISWLDCEQCGKNQYKKLLHVTDPLIIPVIFTSLSCRENAHDNKEFNREYSKPRCELRITTVKSNPARYHNVAMKKKSNEKRYSRN